MLRLGGGLGMAGLLGGALTGCGTGRAAEPVTSGTVDLSFWTHDQVYYDFFAAAAEHAEAAGSRFHWRLHLTQASAQDVVTKSIAQAIAGRGTPDVAGLEIGSFTRLLRGDLAAELLEDLTEDVAEVRDDLLPMRTAPYTKDGRLYALDSDAPLCVFYYRKPEYARLGISPDFASWEEVLDVGERLYEREGVSLGAVAVGSELGQVVQVYEMLTMQRGGRFFDEDGELSIETPEAEQALDVLVRGVQSGCFGTVSDFYGPAMQTALKTGKVISVPMATWYKVYGLRNNVPEQEGEWRIRSLPVFPDGGARTSFTGGTGFAALRGKENTLAGVELIKAGFLTPQEQVRRYVEMGYLPTRRSVFDDPSLSDIEDDYCGGQRMFQVYREVIDEAPVYYLSADRPVLDTVLSGYVLRAYHGDLSPREALGRAADDFRGQTRS
ncbi:extracellular solute-binding protein [Streptomyces hoynatensis]|uniref:Extracellular solute-binding protein n=1 Tax=Streptomyces hoynatensis TaxID=1141874 RepID=A0A3A9YXC3_9ACTN|nr:extracellular solute-binding protein [Streptomyces hoynatensis]